MITRKEAIAELEALNRDPNRDALQEKFKRCPESREVSELLGQAVAHRRGYSRQIRRGDSLPVPRGLVHPG
jgi:hypothetical protein